MFEAERWHSKFPATMVTIPNGSHLFVQDFFLYQDEILGLSLGKLAKCYKKV